MRRIAANLVLWGMLGIPQILFVVQIHGQLEIPADAVNVRIEQPVLIDQAAPEIKTWGPYQFPKIYRLPDGRVCVTFQQFGLDHYRDQGILSPAFVSSDEGHTWKRYTWPSPGITGVDPYITPINDGEYFAIPAVTGLRLDLSRLPRSLGFSNGNAGFQEYRLADCPEDVIRWFKDLKAVRWSPKTGRWTQETVQWDHRGQVILTYNDTVQKIPGDWTQKVYLEGPVLRAGKELMYVEYWTQHETKSGQPPPAIECSLMVSSDNGRSWTRRSSLANLPAQDNTSEPALAMNKAGELVAVMRRDFHESNPSMYLVHSKDDGYTWSEPQTIFGSSVFPQLLQLQDGVLVLSFGRPGVWLSFSLDGGYSWTKPRAIIAGDPANLLKHTCGYTSMLALGRDSFLLTYSDFLRPNAKGEPAKAILVRRITVEKAGE